MFLVTVGRDGIKKFSPITIKIENSVSYNEQVFSIKKKQNNKIL